MYEGTSKSFRALFSLKNFIYATDIRRTLRILFNIIRFVLDTLSSAIYKLLKSTGKKNGALRSQSCIAPFTSSSFTKWWLLELSWVVQTDVIRKQPGLGCSQCPREPPNSFFEWCWWWSVSYEGVHCRVTNNTLWQPSSPFCVNSRPQFFP